MSALISPSTAYAQAPAKLWYTRCAVPTASGIAYDHGWLADQYADQGIDIGILQEAPLDIARHHYDHDLPGLIREGGNVPAIVARSSGAPTRLVGLTWIDERQAIVVRLGDANQGKGLKGLRIAIPGWASERHASHQRAMALAGFESALRHEGLSLSDAVIVEVPVGTTIPPGHLRKRGPKGEWAILDLVANGGADAAYIKGAAAIEAAQAAGLAVEVELDQLPERRFRVNNGTPRPLTVHDDLLQSRPEWVVGFLAQTLRASAWASHHEQEVRAILARETGAGARGVDEAYGLGFHASLAPDLSRERLDLLAIQIEFLDRHNFLSTPFSVDAWVEHGPLEAACALAASYR